MDQDSFRNLLASAAKPGTGRAAGVLGGPAPKRGYAGSYAGSSKPKDLAPKKEEKPAFVPRKTVKKDGKYKDRAEMRRLGLDDEYKPVEQLLEEFERRAKEGGEDSEAIEEQRKYLGGDAQHSILVKGLDYGLLAARKAELEAQETKKFDEELESALHGDSLPAVGPSSVAEKKGKDKERPKTRDEIVAELKRKRMMEEDRDDDIMGVVKKSKTKAEAVEQPKPAALPSKFKSISKQAAPEPDKKKKKKKKVKVEQPAQPAHPASSTYVQGDAPPSIHSSQVEQPEEASSSRLKLESDDKPAAERLEGQIQISPAAPAPPQPPAVVAAESEDDEVEEDIFGGVGEYELNIGSEDEVEQGSSRKARSPTPATPGEEPQAEAAKPRRNWFGDAEDEEEQPVVSLAGSSRRRSGSPAHRAVPRRSTSRSPSPSDEEEGNQGTSRPLPRLQPLASSAGPSARDLLAADKAAQALEKKRARKAKWRAKQGLAPQSNENGDDDDDEGPRGLARIRENDAQEKMKLNRETQKLQAYMSKKDKAKGE